MPLLSRQEQLNEPSENNFASQNVTSNDDYQLAQSRQVQLDRAATNKSSIAVTETIGTTTGIKLVYDPESKQLFR